jgi:hypothetical protein
MTASELKQLLSEAFGPMWLEMSRQADALERIAAAVEQVVKSEPSADVEDPEMGCPHPLEKRLALGTVGDGWQCACGYRELPTKRTN